MVRRWCMGPAALARQCYELPGWVGKYRRIDPDCGLGGIEVGKTWLRRVEVQEKGHDNRAGDSDKAGLDGLAAPYRGLHVGDLSSKKGQEGRLSEPGRPG